VRTYSNPQGAAFRPIQDTSAFACDPPGSVIWTARIFNVDDEMSIVLNGRTLTTVGICGDSGSIPLPLAVGVNVVEFVLRNGPPGVPGGRAAAAWGYELRRNGEVFAADSCGQACVRGCNDDASFPEGEILRRRFVVDN